MFFFSTKHPIDSFSEKKGKKNPVFDFKSTFQYQFQEPGHLIWTEEGHFWSTLRKKETPVCSEESSFLTAKHQLGVKDEVLQWQKIVKGSKIREELKKSETQNFVKLLSIIFWPNDSKIY